MQYLFVLFALLAFACGAPPEADGIDIIGKVEQPIYVPFLFGTEDDQSQCSAPWSGACAAPISRTLDVIYSTSACPSAMRPEMTNACNQFKSFMNNQAGWTVRCIEDGVPTPNMLTKLRCDSATPANALAVTIISQTTDDTWDCDDVPGFGEFCKYDEADVRIYHKNIAAHPAWAVATDAKRRTFFRNVVKHELYHSAGLGHNTSQPDSQLMSPGTVLSAASVNRPWFTTNLNPNDTEKTGLACYQPGSSTQPHPSDKCPL